MLKLLLYFLLGELSKREIWRSNTCSCSIFGNFTTAAEELFESWNHTADIPEESHELDYEQDYAKCRILHPEAEDNDKDEGAQYRDGSNPSFRAEHLADLPFKAGKEECSSERECESRNVWNDEARDCKIFVVRLLQPHAPNENK